MSCTWEDYQTDGCDTSQESISVEAVEYGAEFNRGLDDMVRHIDIALHVAAGLVMAGGCLYLGWHIWKAITR